MNNQASTKKEELLYIRDKAENILAILFYGYFSYIHISSFLNMTRISSLLLIVFETMLLIMLLLRPSAKGFSSSFYDWVVAFTGTLFPLLLRPAPMVHDYILLYIFQLVGLSISTVGAIALNKSFGFVAANRGIKTGGMYRFVRHPLYLGYLISIGSYVLQNMTPINIAIFVIWVFFQVLRIISEEDFLSLDQTYAAYKKKTPWRLIPFIW